MAGRARTPPAAASASRLLPARVRRPMWRRRRLPGQSRSAVVQLRGVPVLRDDGVCRWPRAAPRGAEPAAPRVARVAAAPRRLVGSERAVVPGLRARPCASWACCAASCDALVHARRLGGWPARRWCSAGPIAYLRSALPHGVREERMPPLRLLEQVHVRIQQCVRFLYTGGKRL